MSPKKQAKAAQDASFRVEIKPGWVILDCSTASGGVQYQRVPIDQRKKGEGEVRRFETVKTVDHVLFVREIDKIVKTAEYVLRKHCVRTPFGWFATDEAKAAVEADIVKLKDDADALNHGAAVAGCARRAYIAIVPARLDVGPETVAEVARTVQGTLGELRDMLREGDFKKARNFLSYRCRNLPQLAKGQAQAVIKLALERASEAAKEIADEIKKGAKPHEAGGAVDLESIEAAIAQFDDFEF